MTKAPRHASLSEQLKTLMAYRNRPEGEYEPLQTNWTASVANDNASPEEMAEMRIERRWSMRPTENEIMTSVEQADYKDVPRQARLGIKAEAFPYPVSGDVEYGVHIDENDKSHKVVVRIGKLHFSNGSDTEKAFTYGPDGQVIMFDARMPVGAMLKTQDKQERVLGGEDAAVDVSKSNAYFTGILKAQKAGKVIRAQRQLGKSYNHEEAKAMLKAAIANTAIMPEITKCPTGLPWQPANISSMFMGCKKDGKGESGSVAWQDCSTAMVDRDIWAATVASLSEKDVRVLDVALEAGSFSDIGVAAGMSKNYADKKGGGKRRLLAANDNLMSAINNYAA